MRMNVVMRKITAERHSCGTYALIEDREYKQGGLQSTVTTGDTPYELLAKLKDVEAIRLACDKFYAEIMDSISDFYDMPEVLEQLAIITRNNLETISKMQEDCRERSYQN